MKLAEYNRKRDFKSTAEPKGKIDTSNKARFVIQKHAASHLHYDFRLEIGGTLKSWAVPKGAPFKKGEKRLAMEVEDHPVSYINFEGTIPEGEYGGGTVMVWDKGTYEPLSKSPEKDLAAGKLHFTLQGKKLNGEWYLVRLREGKQWLLIKGGENIKPISRKLDDTSAISGKSMKLISQSNNEWKSGKTSKKTKEKAIKADNKKKIYLPKFVAPMKAKLVDEPPTGNWIYEIKFDGFRTMAFKNGNKVRLVSRNNKSFNDKFPEIVNAIADLNVKTAIIDGEVCALNDKGISSFQLLQSRDLGKGNIPIVFYAFDILNLEGRDLKNQSLSTRKTELEKILPKSRGLIRFSQTLDKNINKLLEHARKLGLEGLIGKNENSKYEVDRRSGSWIKLKLHREQEFVIGGYSDPEGSRDYFGALLLGYYRGNELHFAGRVGTGFNDLLLKKLFSKFAKSTQKDCPFINVPEKKLGRYSSGLTVGEMAKCHWLKPKLVCQVKFTEWTSESKLRHPVFLGLREDKEAAQVIREKAN